MSLLHKIFHHLTVVLTLVAFTISTTGFTIYKHSCSQHESHKSMVSNDDDCCKDLAREVEESPSCCSVKQTCKPDNSEASCCDIELEYNKLSQFFVQSENNSQNINVELISTEIFSLVIENPIECEKTDFPVPPILKKPKKKIYRIFHQVKIEPPLI